MFTSRPLQDLGQLELPTDDGVKGPGDLVLRTDLTDQLVIDIDPSEAEVMVFWFHPNGTRFGGNSSPLELDNGSGSVRHGAWGVVDVWEGLNEDHIDACFG